jgi:hypothetical protein
MLIPAILKKEEIKKAFQSFYYTDDMLYETGGMCSWFPNIPEQTDDGGDIQYAIMDGDKLIGWFGYYIDFYNSCANCFGLFSFDRGNPVIGTDVYKEFKKLWNTYNLHRIEWRMIGGNPVESTYDKLCAKYGGNKCILHDAMKDRRGVYHDNVIYEIVRKS